MFNGTTHNLTPLTLPPQHPRSTRRYHTTRFEQPPNQDHDTSLSASLSKVQLNAVPNDSDPIYEHPLVVSLLREKELHLTAMEKAESMIVLLQEDNKELNKNIEELSEELRQVENENVFLKQQLRQQNRPGRVKTVGILGSRADGQSMRHEDIGAHHVRSRSQLFFELTNRIKEPPLYRSQNKILIPGQVSFKELKDGQVTVSKKLSPYHSRQQSKTHIPATIRGQSVEAGQLWQGLGGLVAAQEAEMSRGMVEELNDLCNNEEEQEEEWKVSVRRREEEVRGLDQQNESRKSRKWESGNKLFTLDREEESVKGLGDLLESYRGVIKQYQEYSAYLKAYLCECLNYLNEVISLARCPPGGRRSDLSLAPLLKMICRDLVGKFKMKYDPLHSQHKELKIITQELIDNYTSHREKERHQGEWASSAVKNIQ